MIHPVPQATIGACRQSQVTERMGELTDALESLRSHIELLVPRLDKVLRQEPPMDGAKTPGGPPTVEVPLASALSERIRHARESQKIIESILSRIEL